MEEVGCNICSSSFARLVFETKRNSRAFGIKRCLDCGLVYLSPRPTHEELREYYSNVYNYNAFLKSADSIKQRCRVDLDLIRKYKNKGNLLEVGCMYGFLLEQAGDMGYEAYGVEISQKAAKYARKNLGLRVFSGQLENSSFQERFFDVVFLSHLIEHLEDPNGSLKMISRIIKDDGVLIIRCPNFASLMSKLTGKHWWWLAPPEHLYHFTPKTIQIMLNNAGFSYLEIHTQRGDLGYLRYLTVGLVNLLPLPKKWKVNYRAIIDDKPQHLSQRILLAVYNFSSPLVSMIHKINMGEEMVIVARKKFQPNDR